MTTTGLTMNRGREYSIVFRPAQADRHARTLCAERREGWQAGDAFRYALSMLRDRLARGPASS
jgi:hypothetical protein